VLELKKKHIVKPATFLKLSLFPPSREAQGSGVEDSYCLAPVR